MDGDHFRFSDIGPLRPWWRRRLGLKRGILLGSLVAIAALAAFAMLHGMRAAPLPDATLIANRQG